MTKFKHIKGQHFSLPSDPFFNIRTVKQPLAQRYQFSFTEENKYIVEGDDQLDFNKLCGLKGKILEPKFDTAMIGWRWRTELGLFEVIPYFHLGSAAHHFDESKIVQLKVGESCTVVIHISGTAVKVIIESGEQRVEDCRNFSAHYKKFGRVSSWFGGNKACPCAMTVEVDNS